jgi:hypothetical protein
MDTHKSNLVLCENILESGTTSYCIEMDMVVVVWSSAMVATWSPFATESFPLLGHIYTTTTFSSSPYNTTTSLLAS